MAPLTPKHRELLDLLVVKHRIEVKPGRGGGFVAGGNVIEPRELADEESPLTLRETEVLALMAEGLGNAAIGERLFIAKETVKSHVRHILHKLNARSRTHAVAIACGAPWTGCSCGDADCGFTRPCEDCAEPTG